jgi:hypothetical protein
VQAAGLGRAAVSQHGHREVAHERGAACCRTSAGRAETGDPLRQNALDPGFHGVPAAAAAFQPPRRSGRRGDLSAWAGGRHEAQARKLRHPFYNELITGMLAGFGRTGCRKMIVYARMYAHT